MPTYNKLVRDNILHILQKDGLRYNARTLNDEEYKQAIKTKLHEEVMEFEQASTTKEAVNELADILELIHAALCVYDMSFDELEQARIEKRNERGSFQKRTLLIDVEDVQ